MIQITVPTFSNPLASFWWLFSHGGFVVVSIALGYGLFWLYLEYIQTRFITNTQYVLLSIDVPKENEQTPKAVEHLFSHLHGIQKNPNWKEKYLDGFVQPTITIELISLGGFIQYLIRCPVANRDLVESAIYAQYPNAEVSEVEDYVDQFPAKFPNDEFDMWGAEVILVKPDAYPIKTYPLWEHSLTQTFLDPMASLLEVMGRLQSGEQIWLQWILRPNQEDKWRNKGLALINKLVGIKDKKQASALDNFVAAPGQVALGTWETITRTIFEPGEAVRKKEDNAPPSLMQHIPPHVRVVVEAIGMKVSKIGFDTKFRFVYLGQKDQFNKARVSGIFGALKQYQSLDMNGFKPDSKMKTQRVWFFVDRRVANLKRRILLGYKYRSIWRGRRVFVLNIEELASLWHFPVITVKAPSVKKMEAKRGEPPTALPVGEDVEYVPTVAPATVPPPAATPTVSTPPSAATPPNNLPVA